jgi:hypothetical protein
VAAGGAALSAGAGAVASAASALFNTVSGTGDGAASGAPSVGPRPHHSTGARPKRKVILSLHIFPHFSPYVCDDIGCRPCSEAWTLIKFPFRWCLFNNCV